MLKAWLERWLPWRKRCSRVLLPHLHVQLYTRHGCPLCTAAQQQLREAQRAYRFQLEEVDIAIDPALTAQYGEQIPVVLIAGKVRFRGAVNAVLLRRLLEGEMAKARPCSRKTAS